MLTGQLAELEERNAEVESQNSTVIQQNLELQQVERELRDNLLTFVSRSELQDVQNKLLRSEQERVCAPITCLCQRAPKIRSDPFKALHKNMRLEQNRIFNFTSYLACHQVS